MIVSRCGVVSGVTRLVNSLGGRGRRYAQGACGCLQFLEYLDFLALTTLKDRKVIFDETRDVVPVLVPNDCRYHHELRLTFKIRRDFRLLCNQEEDG